MGNWKTYKLKDLCTKIGSGATPRGGKESYLAAGISLIRSQNVLDFEFATDGLAFISDGQARQLSNVSVEANDVLLNITGDSVARVCQVPSAVLPARVNQHVAIIRTDPSKLLPELLKYYLLNPSFKNFMLGRASAGATRNALTKGMIEGFEITVPEEIEEQEAIAKILSSLDDKIELNRRMNATLEAMARALFKAWFVDFEPVHANKENRPSTSASPEIAKLFPSDFENGIPKGWRRGIIADIASISKDSVSPGQFPDEEFHHCSIPAFDDSKQPKMEIGSSILSNKFLVKRNSVLVSKLNPRIFRAWTVFPPKGGRCIASTEFIVYEPRQPSQWSFLNSLVRSDEIISSFQQHVTGTSGSHQRVKAESTLNIPIVIPSDQLLETFDQLNVPMYLLVQVNGDQIQSLSRIRDSLLPRLISGKIEVAV